MSNNYNYAIILVDRIIVIIYYLLFKITIIAINLAKIFINIVI